LDQGTRWWSKGKKRGKKRGKKGGKAGGGYDGEGGVLLKRRLSFCTTLAVGRVRQRFGGGSIVVLVQVTALLADCGLGSFFSLILLLFNFVV